MSLEKIVIRQDWVESEKGWGVRPDGYSLHLRLNHVKEFINEYWDMMPDEVPDEYSRPAGSGYAFEVNEDVYKEIERSKNGIRKY